MIQSQNGQPETSGMSPKRAQGWMVTADPSPDPSPPPNTHTRWHSVRNTGVQLIPDSKVLVVGGAQDWHLSRNDAEGGGCAFFIMHQPPLPSLSPSSVTPLGSQPPKCTSEKLTLIFNFYFLPTAFNQVNITVRKQETDGLWTGLLAPRAGFLSKAQVRSDRQGDHITRNIRICPLF